MPAKNVIVRTQFDGTTCTWNFDKEYVLIDGSSWLLDKTPTGGRYNAIATVKERRPSGLLLNPSAEVSRVGKRFYLRIDTMGAKRWVVPVKLPEPSDYYYLKPSQRTPEMLLEHITKLYEVEPETRRPFYFNTY